MPELTPELQAEIREFGDELIERFTPPEFIPGCSVKVITDKDLYATDNGWIECIVSQHNQQRCQWRGQVPNIQINDVVDVIYFKSYRLFVVFGQGGVGSVSQNILHNYAGTVAPTANEDSADGYSVGSHWVDVTNDNSYIAVDVTGGAAVWVQTNASGSGDMVHLAGSVAAGTVTQFDFQSLSGSYETLRIVAALRTDKSGSGTWGATEYDTAKLLINNDTGNNYTGGWGYTGVTGSGAGSDSTVTAATARGYGLLGYIEGGGARSNVFGAHELVIQDYSGTVYEKTIMFESVAGGDRSTGGDFTNCSGIVDWRSTAAINRVTIQPFDGTHFVAGSRIDIYGLTAPNRS